MKYKFKNYKCPKCGSGLFRCTGGWTCISCEIDYDNNLEKMKWNVVHLVEVKILQTQAQLNGLGNIGVMIAIQIGNY